MGLENHRRFVFIFPVRGAHIIGVHQNSMYIAVSSRYTALGLRMRYFYLISGV